MKILITGGHITPALAVADELKARGIHDIVFVGRKYTYADDRETSFEYKEVERAGFRFVDMCRTFFITIRPFR
jgi:UDP-N-acetylglucosamine--N-acetylmuramyl-(pentapeptide) pyrophosphoryl-undecaprenol N-acetylglucosamine transferase